MTYRETLQGLLSRAKGTRKADLEAELAGPPLPSCLAYLWDIFCRLSSRRGSNGSGPNLITYIEIDAFQRVSGVRLNAWEVQTIEAFDRCWIAERYRVKDAST
jgi:hypothetical protein